MTSSSKTSLIAAAVASALGMNAAEALPPGSTINFTLYAAGGSAQENAAFSAVYKLLTGSSVDVYTDQTSGAASPNYVIVTGTTNATGTTALVGSGGAAQNVLFFYKFNGGSFPNGANPFAYATSNASSQLPYPTLANINAAVATSASSPATTPATPTYKFSATATTTNVAPDWGLTDVEVPIFNNLWNLNGTTQLTSTQVTGIQQDGIYDDVFGVAVTNAVFSGTTGFAHPKTNFQKEEVQGILSGIITNWNQLFADDGTVFPSEPIWLLDRGSGSGTKASGNLYFLSYPSSNAVGGSIPPRSVNSSSVNNYTDTILSLTGGYQDVKEASTAAVVADLQNANGNTSGNQYAVAILAAEFAPALEQVGGVNQYSFAKIDGVGIDTGSGADNINGTTSTHYTNVVSGAYDYAYQNSFNTRSGFITAGTSCSGVAAGNAGWACAVRTNLQNVAIAGANSGAAFPNAVTGLLIDPAAQASQAAGVVLWTRYKNSTAPSQNSFDAQSTGGKITYGTDPL